MFQQNKKSIINYGYINRQAYFANKLALIWLYLIKMRVILGKKKIFQKNVKSQFVNGGLHVVRLISWIVLCCYVILMQNLIEF